MHEDVTGAIVIAMQAPYCIRNWMDFRMTYLTCLYFHRKQVKKMTLTGEVQYMIDFNEFNEWIFVLIFLTIHSRIFLHINI